MSIIDDVKQPYSEMALLLQRYAQDRAAPERDYAIPIEMVRASLTGQSLSKTFSPQWTFLGTNSG